MRNILPPSRFQPFHSRYTLYALQFLVALAILGIVWYIDPMGWRRTTTTLPQDSTVYGSLTQIENLQGRLSQDPKNARLQIDLAALYLQYVRESGDPSYYNKADELLTQARDANANDEFAMVETGALALARHDFTGALAWGKRAAALNDHQRLAYGIIGDAQVELGNYEAARAAFDKMVTLRPDINSYARISYMRELYGDVAGAMDAMKLATRVGLQNTEGSNWARVQLGNLYFNTGQLDQAEQEYQTALQLYPGYLHALAGVGRVNAARGNYDRAIQFYQQALRQIPIPEYVIALGDVYTAAGNAAAADKQYKLVGAIQQLFIANGVNNDLELALFNADHRIAPQETVAQARAAYEKRPSIYGADVVAWALYQNGEYRRDDYIAAQEFSNKALALGMQDALKYYHAGMIAFQLGDKANARQQLARALSINPHFSLRYAESARQTLAQVQ